MNLSFENVDQLCNGVALDDENPVIDLSGVTFFRPFALVYLGMYLRYHTANGKGFIVMLPENDRARRYLAQQNFWERFNFDSASIEAEKLRRFTTSTSPNDILDIEHRQYIAEDIAGEVYKVLVRSRVNIKVSLVSEMICELVDNFASPSKETLATVAMQYYPNLRRVVLAVGDCGIGIRSSLSSNPKHAYLEKLPHYTAALESFEPLVTRMSEGGTGLTDVRDQITNMNGRLICSTGDGYVIISQGEATYGNMAYDLPGVQMEISLPEE